MARATAGASACPPPPDADLALAAQGGGKRAFVEIVARHQAMVYGIALGVLGDFAESEDAAQEAFVVAWQRIGKLREPEKLRPWLAQIARNVALGHLRRARGRQMPTVGEGLADEDQLAPDQLTVSEEEAALVREALHNLPETFRLPLVLFYCQDQSTREVAEALDLSEDAVRKRLARGRELLRERMSGLVETVLRNTRPGSVFTTTIASSIGAFTAAAAASAAASSTPAAVTAMTTSKLSLTTSALIVAACLPLGYAVHFASGPPARETAPPMARTGEAAPAPAPAPPDFSGSELFAEWVRLHEEHGHDAGAMPGLFKAISGIKDTFQRRAYSAALAAEWAQVDPGGGLDFFLGENGNRHVARQLVREWLAREPQAAVAKLLELGDKGIKLAEEADILSDIARRAPEQVAEIAARLPENTDHWNSPVRDAFAILAEKDLASALAAAEALGGPRREEALGGVAKAWAKRDFESAATWVRQLPEGTDRDGLLRDALMGLAAIDPTAALDKADLVPPGGRPGFFADSTVARLLKDVREEDFTQVTDWLREYPGKFSREDIDGLSHIVTSRLNTDPLAFLEEQRSRGMLGLLEPALNSALLNGSKQQLAKVWEWVKTQPEGEAIKALRKTVFNSAGWQNPELALAIAREQIATSPGSDEILGDLTRSLLNGGSRMNRLERLLEEAPDQMRVPLLAEAFQYITPEAISDPAPWVARLEEIPEEMRARVAANFAGAWANNNPEDAAAWVGQLPAGESRLEAVRNVAGAWLNSDSLRASEWIARLPAGAERDAGAGMLVDEISGDSPGEAWQWAINIGDATQRLNSTQKALSSVARQYPGEALRWINSSPLAEAEKQTLRKAVNAGNLVTPSR